MEKIGVSAGRRQEGWRRRNVLRTEPGVDGNRHLAFEGSVLSALGWQRTAAS